MAHDTKSGGAGPTDRGPSGQGGPSQSTGTGAGGGRGGAGGDRDGRPGPSGALFARFGLDPLAVLGTGLSLFKTFGTRRPKFSFTPAELAAEAARRNLLAVVGNQGAGASILASRPTPNAGAQIFGG